MADRPYVTETKAGLGVRLDPYEIRILFPPHHESYARRWERSGLKELIQPDEAVVWVDVAATGMRGHPLGDLVPVVWGSIWDTAITSRRFIAVQLRLLPSLKRTCTLYSIPWTNASHAELCLCTGLLGVVVLGIRAGPVDRRFRLYHAAFDYNGAVNALRRAKPDAITKTGLFVPR